MGIDLTLLPIKYHENFGEWLTYERLGLDRNYELFCQFTDMIDRGLPAPILSPRPLPEKHSKIMWYGDEGIEETAEDPYGDPLTYLFASDFRKVAIPEYRDPWNRAVIAFICALPPDTPVVLWWH